MAKKIPSFFEVLNKSQETKTVDLLIYGAIPSWDEDTYKMKNSADSFLKEFKALEKDYDRINIHINSPGGSLYHAFPIFNALVNSKKDIHTYNDGLAASAGGLLLLAGKKVHTAKNGILMIHNAQGMAFGSADRMRDVAATLETYDHVIVKLFAERTGKPAEEIKEKYLNYKDHWLDADEAKEAGFVHEIEDYESEDAPPSNITEMAFDEVLNLYREREIQSESFIQKVINSVRDALTPSSLPTQSTDPASEENSPENQPPHIPMDFKNSLEILNKDQVSAEDLAAIRAEIEAFTGANEKFTAEEVNAKVDAAKLEIQNQLDQVTAEKTALDTQVSDLESTVASYKATGVTPSNTTGTDTDPIPGEEVENFFSETDLEVKNMRQTAGLA